MRVRESMASLTPKYSANRSVREYVERCYLPAAAAYLARAENGAALGLQITHWQRMLEQSWPTARFGRAGIEPLADRYEFEVEVTLGELDPHAVRVELYADPRVGAEVFRQDMTRLDRQTDPEGRTLYVASVPATRGSSDYTARIVPAFSGVSVPLEANHVLWQR
jgi:starch phosphorylase